MNQDSLNQSQRKYSQIKTEQRLKLLDDILVKGLSIKQAANKNGIKFSSAKVILKLYRNEGRVGKLDEEKIQKLQSISEKNDIIEVDFHTDAQCKHLEEQIEIIKTRNNYLQLLLNNYQLMNCNVIQK